MDLQPIKPLVREALKAYANEPHTIQSLAKETGSTSAHAKSRTQKLVEAGYVERFGEYHIITELGKTALIHAPVEGNHFGAYSKARPTQIKTKMDGTYDCPELKRNPGLPDDRYEAFDKPSRIGNKLFYRDGRTEDYPN